MSVTDILLHIDSYPEPTPPRAVDRAIALAGIFGGTLTALVVEVDFPVRSNQVADYLIGLTAMARQEEAKCRRQCDEILISFAAAAGAAGLAYETLQARAQLFEVPAHVAIAARSRDLCIVPLGGRFDGQQDVARSVLFDSGRPVVVFSDATRDRAQTLDVVVVAWDGSRAAARAMADAMPVLVKARSVRVLTVAGDKPDVDADLRIEALRHLAMHGVQAVADVVQARGEGIGHVIAGYLADQSADLLVMGAYGHSRAREFVLGGATQHMLANPVVPLLMSH